MANRITNFCRNLENLIDDSESEMPINCIFFEDESGAWKHAESDALYSLHPLSQELFYVSEEFKEIIPELSNDDLFGFKNSLYLVLKKLLSMDELNDSTGYNLINLNDMVNFMSFSCFYISCIGELQNRNILDDENRLKAQKITMTMCQARLNGLSLFPAIAPWSESIDNYDYHNGVADFNEFLFGHEGKIFEQLGKQTQSLFPEAISKYNQILATTNNEDVILDEIILLADFERQLKESDKEQRAFSVFYTYSLLKKMFSRQGKIV